jgi:sulfate/thiosulfate transport system ATP-binding protein
LPGQWQDGRLRVAGLELSAASATAGHGEVELFVRPEHLQISAGGEGWPATIVSSQRSGARQRVWARLSGHQTEVEVELPAGAGRQTHAPGAEIRLQPTHFGLFPR